jgi:hypothetical protein
MAEWINHAFASSAVVHCFGVAARAIRLARRVALGLHLHRAVDRSWSV